jgi:membrane-associated phospholipid phosphatase
MTDALVLHRDGIVGTFLPGTAVGDLTVDDPKNLLRWEPWVRASILDFELVTPLRLTKDSATTYTLWHVDAIANQNPTFTPIASMVKPPEATLLAQLALVEGYSALRADRASEILAQLGPGTAFWSSVVNLHPDRTRWTIEIIDIALRLANFVEMRFKQALSCRRPVEFSSQVQPMILTPGHGTLPSGHATESFMIAYLLWRLMKDKGRSVAWLEQLMRQANRIAVNRTVAGVHFPVDSAAGALLGLTLGQYFYRRATGSSNYQ